MKIKVTHAGPIITGSGPVHLHNEYSDVKDFSFSEDGKRLYIVLNNDAQIVFNTQYVLSVEADPYGSIARVNPIVTA